MDIASYIDNDRPTKEQAIKILKKLVDTYAPVLHPEEQTYLEDYASELKATSPHLDETARIIDRILSPEIKIVINACGKDLHDAQEIEAQSRICRTNYNEANAQKGDITVDFDEVVSMHIADQETRQELGIKLHEFITDLRSLQRAVTSLTTPEEPTFTRHDALMAIMQYAPN